ncbi:MAG: hypothetical protein ACRDQI_18340 [Pseudonocardiaceae bacterium]
MLTSWVAGGNLRECRRPEPLLIGMRFDSSEIGNSLTEIVAYGSAVVVEPDV